jgi:hypothetical protein
MNHVEVYPLQTKSFQTGSQGVDDVPPAEAPGEGSVFGHDHGRFLIASDETAQEPFGLAQGIDFGRIEQGDAGPKGNVEGVATIGGRLVFTKAPRSGADPQGSDLWAAWTKLYGGELFPFSHDAPPEVLPESTEVGETEAVRKCPALGRGPGTFVGRPFLRSISLLLKLAQYNRNLSKMWVRKCGKTLFIHPRELATQQNQAEQRSSRVELRVYLRRQSYRQRER